MDIKVTSDGIGHGTVVTVDGRPLKGVCGIEIDPINGPDDIVTARLRFVPLKLNMVAQAVAQMCHPETGEIMDVASIRFSDGSEFTF